jgi:hypothetical protein
MDKFEEIGRRIDEEVARLRRFVEEEVAPETERRTASFLRDVSGKLSEAASKLEARYEARGSSRSAAGACGAQGTSPNPTEHTET